MIGSGAAGMQTALVAAEHCDVLLLTDRAFGRSNSVHAQGGLQRPDDTDASRQAMIEDIVRSARGDIDMHHLKAIVAQSAAVIDALRDAGVPFDTDPGGNYVRHTAGGISGNRVVSAGDRIGSSLIGVLGAQIKSHERIEIRSWSSVVGLRRADPAGWVIAIESRDRDQYELQSFIVVVATGGASFAHANAERLPTTNPQNNNISMINILVAAGLEQSGSNRFQFHPLGVILNNRDRVVRCAPERIVNLGIRLVDRHNQPIADVGADRWNVLAGYRRALTDRRLVTRDGLVGVRLALSDVAWDSIVESFPAFSAWAERRGLDSEDPIVQPAVHYQLDGFAVHSDGSAGLAGLYLAGEISGGVHGANRLMGMGLTQSLVDGHLTGHAAGRAATSQ